MPPDSAVKTPTTARVITPRTTAYSAIVAKQRATETQEEIGRDERPARSSNWKPLGTLLTDKGFITEVQLKQALAIQRDTGGFLGEILVEQGWLAAADLVLALAAQLGLDFDVRRATEDRDEASILPSERPA